jgi:hypothetical protein
MSKLVTDEMVEAALAALSLETARQAGKAKADEIRADEARKATLARLKRECNVAKSNADKEDWARVQPDYQQAVDRYADAAGRWEYHRDLRSKAEALLSAWQTENANDRAARRMS